MIPRGRYLRFYGGKWRPNIVFCGRNCMVGKEFLFETEGIDALFCTRVRTSCFALAEGLQNIFCRTPRKSDRISARGFASSTRWIHVSISSSLEHFSHETQRLKRIFDATPRTLRKMAWTLLAPGTSPGRVRDIFVQRMQETLGLYISNRRIHMILCKSVEIHAILAAAWWQ